MIAFSTNSGGAIGHSCAKKKQKQKHESWSADHIYTNISWKWIMKLNAKCKSIKYLEKIRKSLWSRLVKKGFKWHKSIGHKEKER